jgi:hypothetical protein
VLQSSTRNWRAPAGSRDPPLVWNKLIEAAANIVENNKLTCGYNKEDRDTAMSSLGESEIDDDNDENDDIHDVLSNLINKAADLSPFRYKSPL